MKKIVVRFIIIVVAYLTGFFLAVKGKSLINLLTYRYPALGDYYLEIEVDKDENIIGHAMYAQEIYNSEIDLSNMILEYRETDLLQIDRDDLFDTNKLRIFLLENGIGIIKDEHFATEDEIKAQNHAKKKNNGIWGEEKQENQRETIGKKVEFVWFDFINKLYMFMDKINTYRALKWILISGIGIGTIIAFIYRQIMKDKFNMVFLGASDSGKTTFFNRFLSPFIHRDQLENKTSPSTGTVIQKGNPQKYDGREITPYVIDNPGTKLGYMMDELLKRKYSNTVAIIMLAYSPDKTKLISETTTALNLANLIKTSEHLRKVNKVVLFINKADYFFKSYKDFRENKDRIYSEFLPEQLKDLKKSVDYVECGSALEGWNVEEVINWVKSCVI